jgi:tetratricopeptide (TPR) repeat protein
MVNDRNMKTTIGLGLFLGVFLFYFLNLPGFAFPNEWSAALYSILGLDPFRPLSRPLWQAIMSVLGSVSGPHVVMAANGTAALCGAVAALLMFHVGMRMRKPVKPLGKASDQRVLDRARVVSGLVAAGFLAVSAPFIIVSTRIHPLSLDLCLLLAAVLVSLLYRDSGRPVYWFSFMLLYGMGVAEFSTFILLGPVFLILWSWLLWRGRSFRWFHLPVGLLLAVAGASIGLLFSYDYAGSPVAAWREFDSARTVYTYFLLDQYQQIRFSVPKQGWLIVLLTMVLPAVYIIWNGLEEADDVFTNIGHVALRVILLGVAVVILFNLPGSPWRVMGPSVTLVTPYAITALWFGQLAGFFYRRLALPPIDRLRRRPVSPWPSRVLLAATAVFIGVAGFLNMARATPKQAAPVMSLARDVLDGLEENSFLITNGSLDSSMQWLAYQEGRSVRFIDRSRAGSRAYMKFLTTWFDDPQLESMAEIGLGPFIDVWMSGNTNLHTKLAIQDVPEFWTLQGFTSIPALGIYRGIPLGADEANPPVDMQDRLAFLARHTGAFGAAATPPELVRGMMRELGRQLGVFANNVGFFLAGQDRWPEAIAAFETALQYDPANISVLINLADAAEREGRAEDAARYTEDYKKHLTAFAAPLPPRRLVAQYGQVRNPMLFMQEGVALIQSGMTDLGVERLRDAMALPGDDRIAEFALAQALFDSGNIAKSHEQFLALSKQHPSNQAVWLGLARCQVLLGKAPEAEASFERLRSLGFPAARLDMERGFMLLQAGLFPDARRLFDQILSGESVAGPAAVGLIWAASRLGDTEAIARAVPVLKERPNYFAGQMVLYELAMASRDAMSARESLLLARRVQPGNTDVIEKLIQLELLLGREQPAKLLLDKLLELDSESSYGNYLLAGIHEKNGRLDLAEIALRRALPRDQRGEAAYGLAWVLEKQGKRDEALAMSDLALSRQPESPQFLAVKGVILAARSEWDQAEALLKQAITLRTDREIPLFQLHLAILYAASGRPEQALPIMQVWTPRKAELSDDETALLTKLEEMLSATVR